MRIARISFAAAALVVASACDGCPTCPKSDGTCCAAGDAACVQAHLDISIVDNDANNNILFSHDGLQDIPAGKVQQSQLVDGKGKPSVVDAVSSSGAAPSLCYSPNDTLIAIPFSYSDPNGASPGGCFHVHAKGSPPGPFGGFPMRAFPSNPDGQTSGSVSIFITFKLPSNPGDVVVDFFPIAPADPSAEAVAQLLNGGAVVVGDPVSMATTIQADDCNQGGNGGGGPGTCPDGHPCDTSGGHVCCQQSDGSYQCLLGGLCQ